MEVMQVSQARRTCQWKIYRMYWNRYDDGNGADNEEDVEGADIDENVIVSQYRKKTTTGT